MKRGLIPIILLILINLTSAYNGDQFSLEDLLDRIDPSTLILGATFIISFAIINFALTKAFQGNKSTAGIVSFSIALLITYGIHRTEYNLEELFFNIGISEEILYTIIPFILIMSLIYLGVSKKAGFSTLLIIFGGFLVSAGIMNLVHEKFIVIAIGTIIALIGIWMKQEGKTELKNILPIIGIIAAIIIIAGILIGGFKMISYFLSSPVGLLLIILIIVAWIMHKKKPRTRSIQELNEKYRHYTEELRELSKKAEKRPLTKKELHKMKRYSQAIEAIKNIANKK